MSDQGTCRVYNILLLGPTGVGKSTFINSIANYFTYKDFDEAMEINEPVCLIPSSFSVSLQSNFKKIVISQRGINGADIHNEHFNGASSSTKSPRIYRFHNHETEINFIDVPGIGDTEGTIRDGINKKIIADKIKEFSQIHAILILLKPTEVRLTAEIKYDLNELLLMLHQNAVPNIMFVITNSRGQNYMPGPTRFILEDYAKDLKENKNITLELNQNTIFCVDNEGYNFQCGWNKSEEFRKENVQLRRNYKKSWNFSKKAIYQLVIRIYTLRGHDVTQTWAIGQVRTIIHCAIGPLATITTIIQRAMTPASREEQIQSLMSSGNEIKQEVEIQKTLPQTVCTSTKCVEAIKIPGTKQYNFNFKTVCHDKCFLRNVPLAKFPEPALEDCQAFDLEGNCYHCGCRVERHMHINSKQSQKQILKKVANKPLTRQEAEKFMDLFIKKQLEEQKAIINAIAKLSCYLKQNAILEYNNAFEERIKVEMRKEEAAHSQGNNDSMEIIAKLEKTLDHYKSEMRAIDASIQKESIAKVTEEEVHKLLNSLFILPQNGNNIRTLYEAESMPCNDVPEKKTSQECVSYFVNNLP